MAVDDVDALPLGDVPHEDEVVVPGGQQDVLGRRVPLQVHDAPSVRWNGEYESFCGGFLANMFIFVLVRLQFRMTQTKILVYSHFSKHACAWQP